MTDNLLKICESPCLPLPSTFYKLVLQTASLIKFSLLKNFQSQSFHLFLGQPKHCTWFRHKQLFSKRKKTSSNFAPTPAIYFRNCSINCCMASKKVLIRCMNKNSKNLFSTPTKRPNSRNSIATNFWSQKFHLVNILSNCI